MLVIHQQDYPVKDFFIKWDHIHYEKFAYQEIENIYHPQIVDQTYNC